MRTSLTVTAAATSTALTTIDRVKLELGIADSLSDAILQVKIGEASSDIEAHLGRVLGQETVAETFWGDPGVAEFLVLDRTPVTAISAVTEDGVAVDDAEWRLDAEAGLIYRLDASGYPSRFCWGQAVVVTYAGGYVLPASVDRTLPPAIEAAAVELVQSFWFARGRDPLVKAEEVPGVMRQEFWVGAVGEAGELPPSVVAKLAPFRRASV